MVLEIFSPAQPVGVGGRGVGEIGSSQILLIRLTVYLEVVEFFILERIREFLNDVVLDRLGTPFLVSQANGNIYRLLVFCGLLA